MSKRQIEVQGTKEGRSFIGDGSAAVNPDDVPKKATAAQLANRKLKSIKPTARKHTPGLQPTIPAGSSQGSGLGQQPQGTTSFAFGSQQPNAPLPTSFGGQPPQQQGGSIFGGATSSFPPAQSASPGASFITSSFPAFGGGASATPSLFSPTPPASGFNFSAGGPNPFAPANSAPAINGASSSGFSGSIFNLAPSQPATAMSGENAQPDPPNPQALASPFKFGATAAPASKAPASNIFGSSTGPSSNLFGASTQNNAPSPNIFGQSNGPSTPFGTAADKKPFSPDAMQTSPDLPMKPASPAATLLQPKGGSLMERITAADPKPLDTPVQSVETLQAEKPSQSVFGGFGQTTAAKETPKPENPFARLARTPSPAKEAAPPAPAQSSKPANPFTSLQRPMTQPGQSTPSQTSNQASNIFAPKTSFTPFASPSKPAEPAVPPSNSAPSSMANPFSGLSKTSESSPSPKQPPSSMANPFSDLSKPSEPVPSPKQPPSSMANPFSTLSKPAEPVPSPKQPPSPPPAAATPAQKPSLALPPSSTPSTTPYQKSLFAPVPALGMGMPSTSFAPVKSSPLKNSIPAEFSPPSNKGNSVFEQSMNASTSTGTRNDGTTDAITYDPATGRITSVDLVKATLTDMMKALNDGPPADTDDLGREIWCQREKLRCLNVGYRDRINAAGVYTDWTGLASWYVRVGNEICALLKTAKRKKAALQEATSGPMNASVKRKADPEVGGQQDTTGSVAKKFKEGGQGFVPQRPMSETAQALTSLLNGGPAPPPTFSEPSAPSSASGTPAPSDVLEATAHTAKESTKGVDYPAFVPEFGVKPMPSFGSQSTASNPFASARKEPASAIFSPTPNKKPASNGFNAVPKEATPNTFSPKVPLANPFAALSLPATQNATKNGAGTPTPAFKPSFVPTGNNSEAPAPSAFKPLPAASTPGGLEVPKFSIGSGAPNFLQQFAKKAKTSEELEADAKKKAMQDELDSDDSDYEEERAAFEVKWEEEQRQKRAKQAAESLKAPVFQFTPTGSNASSDSEAPAKAAFSMGRPTSAASSNGPLISRTNSPTPSTTGGTSVFDAAPAVSSKTNNIFGHLSSAESGADDGKDDDEEDTDEDDGKQSTEANPSVTTRNSIKRKEIEQSEDDEIEETLRRKRQDRTPDAEKEIGASQASAQPNSRSMFDRISHGPDGKPEREARSTETEKANGLSPTPPKRKLFGQTLPPAASSSFSPNTSLSLSGDQTFKHNSPIKFASSTPAPFSFNATSSANNANPFGHLASTPSANANTTNLFGHLTASSGPAFGTPAASLFPPAPSGFPSGFSSSFTSRAVTPFSSDELSGKESGDAANKSQEDEDKLTDAQVRLTDLSEAEKEENEVLYECEKSKALEHDKSSASAEGPWTSRGVGPLRILKHKQTGVVSLLMRAAPGGRIVVNTRLLAGFSVTGGSKTMRVHFPTTGKKMTTWCFKFGTTEAAAEFQKTYNDNLPTKP